MKPPFLWRGLCLNSRVSMIVVCVFLYRSYNEVRIPCSINLSVKSSTSTIDAKFVEGDLETTGCMYVCFIHTAMSHASFILCQFWWPYFLRWGPLQQNGYGVVLQIGRILVRFQMVSLEFFIDVILLIALWPWGRQTL